MLEVVRIFLKSEGSAKWTVLAALFFASIAEGLGLATLLPVIAVAFGDEDSSVITKTVLDVLKSMGIPADLGVLLGIVVTAMVVKAVLFILAMRHVAQVVANVATRVRIALVTALLSVRWQYFTGQQVGKIANTASLDCTRAGDAYMIATQTIATFFQVIMTLAIAIVISWQAAIVGILVGVTIALLLLPLVRMARKAGKKQRQRTEDLVMLLSDTLSNIKPLKAMARQAPFAEFFTKKTLSLRRAMRQEAMSRHSMKALRDPIIAGIIALGFYVVHRWFDVGLPEMLLMGILLARIVGSIGKVQDQQQRAMVLHAAFWSVHGMIADAESKQETFTGTREPTLNQGCRLDNVTFGYGAHTVLDRASIEAPANQLTVITGPSGIGKTTITDLILGLYAPQSGRVLVDGVPLSEIDVQAWRSSIGYVPQELALFHDTVFANVALGDPTVTVEDVQVALDRAGAGSFVADLPKGVHTTVGERGSMLSGGQRQRIALARALVFKPKLLIMDEVTSALDPRTEAAICENIKALAGSVTMVAVTHRPIWLDLADRVYEVTPDGVELKHLAKDGRQREPVPA